MSQSYLSPIEDCNREELIWVYTTVVFGAICFFSSIIVGHRFIKSVSPTEKATALKYVEISYVILVCTSLLLITTTSACICICHQANHQFSKFTSLFQSLFVAMDSVGFHFILFLRIYFIFRTSIWKLTTFNIIYYVTSFIVTTCYYVGIIVTYNLYDIMTVKLSAILNGIAVLLTMNLILSLMVLFISKLRRIYQADTQKDEMFLMMIKTSTIMIGVSFTAKILMSVFISLREEYDAVSIYYIAKLFSYLNVCVDFLCIVLAHHQLNGYYRKICWFVESLCTLLCCNETCCKRRDIFSVKGTKILDQSNATLSAFSRSSPEAVDASKGCAGAMHVELTASTAKEEPIQQK